jgi:hypothetical protein
MIGILLEGESEFLETAPGTSINLKLESPLFGDGEKLSPGSYSLPFTLPAGEKSPGNAAQLGNPDVIENTQAYTLKKATLFASSETPAPIPFKSGNLKTKSGDRDQVQAHFTFGLNSIDESLKTAKLREVMAQAVVVDATPITKKIYLKKIGGGDWVVTVNGTSYSAVDAGALRNAINTDALALEDTGFYAPLVELEATDPTPGGITASYLVLKMVLYYTFYDDILDLTFHLTQDSTDPLVELNIKTETPADYEVEGDLGDYHAGFTTFMAPYQSGTYAHEGLRFPVIFNGNPYPDASTLKDGELVNGANSGGLILNAHNWGQDNAAPFQVKNYNSIQPFVLRSYVLDKIADQFGFTWGGDFYDHADLATMLEWNTAALDYPLAFIGESKFVFWRRSFDVSELVPDITVVEYLKRLAGRYNLAVYYNEATQKVHLSFREEISKSLAFDDITAFTSPVGKVDDQRVTGFTLSLKKDETDTATSDETVVVGTSEEVIEMACGRLFQTVGTVVEGAAVSGPRVIQKFGDKGMMRTFYYSGIVDVGAFTYAAAAIQGATIYEALNDFIITTGLYNQFWKYWLHYLQNARGVTVVPDWPLRTLLRFDWEQKRRFNRVNYLVKSIDVTITNKTLKVNSAELITQH